MIKNLMLILGLKIRESNQFRCFLKILFLFSFFQVFIFTIHSSVYAATYCNDASYSGNCYVDGNSGLDTNNGKTSATAWKTIQNAADNVGPGDTVNVKGGITYTGSHNCNTADPAVVCLSISGTSGNVIKYQAWTGTGVPIIDGNNQTREGFVINQAKFINISGFLIKNTGVGFYLQWLSNDIKVYHNIFYNNTYGMIAGNLLTSNILIKNNIIVNSSSYGIAFNNGGAANFTADYNLLWGNAENYLTGIVAGTHDVYANPLFVDSTNGDFHLSKNSPAINAGTTLTDVPLDVFGVSRPQGSGYDIGVYEYYDMTVDPISPQGYTKDNTKPILSFKKATTASTISTYSVYLDSGKNKNYSTSGISSSSDNSKSYSIWKDDSDVKIEYFNENDANTSNHEIKAYFKGLDKQELTEGKHSWTVTAYDNASNSITKSLEFSIDKTSPNFRDLYLVNVSSISNNGEYNLNTNNRMPSFSGLISDPYTGSEKTNTNNSKDTFDKVASGPQTLYLNIKKLTTGQSPTQTNPTYIDYLSKDYSIFSSDIKDTVNVDKSYRFYVTTPSLLADGYYKVTLTVKDVAGNTYSQPVFYLSLNYNGAKTANSVLTPVVSPINNSPDNNQDEINSKSLVSPTPFPYTSIVPHVSDITQPKFNLLTWFINLIKGLLGR